MARTLITLLLVIACAPAWAGERWAVYYTDKLPAEAFDAYNLVVFDSDHHPPLAPLKARGKTVLGYLSLGEAEKYRGYFRDIERKKLLIRDNKRWKGHFVIDIRKPAWREMVVDTLIPAILAQGFDGVMLDTADSLLQAELDDAKRYAGMRQATIDTIRLIRDRHPKAKIMLNRSFSILPEVAGAIDMIMAESIYTDWQPDQKAPGMVSGEDYERQMNALRDAMARQPALKIYTIDYWPPEDSAGVKYIYAHQRGLGFIPYVGPLDLQTLHPEPQ